MISTFYSACSSQFFSNRKTLRIKSLLTLGSKLFKSEAGSRSAPVAPESFHRVLYASSAEVSKQQPVQVSHNNTLF